jgi:hypothetical protein
VEARCPSNASPSFIGATQNAIELAKLERNFLMGVRIRIARVEDPGRDIC